MSNTAQDLRKKKLQYLSKRKLKSLYVAAKSENKILLVHYKNGNGSDCICHVTWEIPTPRNRTTFSSAPRIFYIAAHLLFTPIAGKVEFYNRQWSAVLATKESLLLCLDKPLDSEMITKILAGTLQVL